jgi:hypothetical protein
VVQPFDVEFRNVLEQAPLGVALHVAALRHEPDDRRHRHLAVNLGSMLWITFYFVAILNALLSKLLGSFLKTNYLAEQLLLYIESKSSKLLHVFGQ